MRKLLHRMRKGSADINAIARDLDIRRGTLEAILEMAVRGGYLEKANAASSCGACFLSGRCGVDPSECNKTEIYILTPEGKKYGGF